MLSKKDIQMLNGADLAFIGDSYYENYIREYILNKGITSLKNLHNESVNYVSRTGQYLIIQELVNELTEEEMSIYKRGRNFNYKNKTPEYIMASGFEALIGYLYLLRENDRLKYILERSIEIIEKV